MAKIMVIDDEQHVCDLLRQVLEGENFTVITTTDPVAGIDIVKNERPDCVLLDVKMPGASGIEVLAQIKAFDARIDVIMITAYGELNDAMDCVRLGAYEYIAKPFEIDFIKDLVKRCVESKKT